ncbi:MAG TPA: hypothetical protein DIV86_01745 [Alphaproteobacteria bacterium]|nr:hypothetical protein [Alphaproteobacteria bacterium]
MPSDRIRKLNDQFRSTLSGGMVALTEGISCLCSTLKFEILCEVQCYNKFDKGNDPYGEHDFGSFKHPIAGKIFWKIDYYNLDMKYHSEDPADPRKTKRVLTIMLAEEY